MNDIVKCITDNPIKNGTILVGCHRTGFPLVYDAAIKNTPYIEDIQDKYDNRYDDPSYYYGIGNSTVIGG